MAAAARHPLRLLALAALAACGRQGAAPSPEQTMPGTAAPVRIGFLHHSTGERIWKGGMPAFIQAWNAGHGTRYQLTELSYPEAIGGHTRLHRLLPGRVFNKVVPHYAWSNGPWDYWNLWVAHQGGARDQAELNLDDLARRYDVIVFKHCYPVSDVKADDGHPDVASRVQTLANYKLQYQALKARLHQFPGTRFIVWTGAALDQASTGPDEAGRAREFARWVKDSWDEPGDNIFVWDFRDLETGGGLYLKPEFAVAPGDPYPNPAFAAMAAPLIGRRIVDVIEGRGDGPAQP